MHLFDGGAFPAVVVFILTGRPALVGRVLAGVRRSALYLAGMGCRWVSMGPREEAAGGRRTFLTAGLFPPSFFLSSLGPPPPSPAVCAGMRSCWPLSCSWWPVTGPAFAFTCSCSLAVFFVLVLVLAIDADMGCRCGSPALPASRSCFSSSWVGVFLLSSLTLAVVVGCLVVTVWVFSG
jgi:hypothetical protein